MMMDLIRKHWHAAAMVAAAATLLTGIAASGILNNLDTSLADRWYQKSQASSGDIVLVSIDQRALEDIGPYSQWNRDIMSMVLENLNADEENRPAVIGLDILYAGETEPVLDEWLAEAAGKYQNVVTASIAEFGTELQENEQGEKFLNTFAVLNYIPPFSQLEEVTTQGHINTMLDDDGVMRHLILDIKLPDGRTIPSFSLAIADKFRAFQGLEPVERPETDSRGFWYLPFTGEPGYYDEGISVADILSGEVPPEYLAGKIVLIGPYTVAMQDAYKASINHAKDMYGVEIHANAVEALLRGEFKKEAGNLAQLIVLFVTLMIGGMISWFCPLKIATAGWLCGTAGWLALTRYFYAQGTILRVLWMPGGLTVLFIACIVIHYMRAAMEKHQLVNMFQHYVDPSIVKELIDAGYENLGLGGRTVNIAVLFVDVRGFTTMSEALDPETVVQILDQYLTLIADCIMKNHGTLDKYVGDCAMAFWGAPLPQEDYIMHACQAAMDMVDGSKVLSEELMKKYGRTVSFGIGVNVGDAVVGNMGSPQRMDYTAIGDTVNTAARLEANAPAGTIYISRAVADALGDRIRTTSLGGTIKLKGKKDGFEILTLDEIVEG